MLLLDWNYYSLGLIGLVSFAYIEYYLMEIIKRPVLAVNSGPFKKYLFDNVPMLQNKFWPTFWCFESRLQTIIASIWRRVVVPKSSFRRELLTLKDGGELALDWSDGNCKEDSPLILILPGLTGDSQAEYIRCLVKSANNMGARAVVFNNRGLGGIELKTPRLYCAANFDDLTEAVHHISESNPNAKMGAIGISMGGLVLGNYLARYGEEAHKFFTACQIISSPYNMHKGCVSLEKPYLNKLLNKVLAKRLCEMISSYKALHTIEDIDFDVVMKCKSFRELDIHFTTKHFGYRDVEHYYSAGSLHNKLHKISVPLLCLSAADDFFQPLEAIPTEAAEKSSHVAILVTPRGGHVGFMEGFWPKTGDEYMARFFTQFFRSTLFNDEFKQVSEEMMKTYPRPAFYNEPIVFAPSI